MNYTPEKGEYALINNRLWKVRQVEFSLRKPNLFSKAVHTCTRVWCEDVGTSHNILTCFPFHDVNWQQAIVDATFILHQAKAIQFYGH